MEDMLYTRIQQKIDTQANWARNNPVLLAGEIGFVIMENGSVHLVVGDGENNFKNLTNRTLYVPTTVAELTDSDNYALKADIPDGVIVDASLSETSTNAIQNKAVTNELKNKANKSETYTKQEVDNAISGVNVSVSNNDETLAWNQEVVIATVSGTDITAKLPTEPVSNITTGTTNGTIKVDSDDIPVKGLNSAAYKAESYFATSTNVTTLTNRVTALETTINSIASVEGVTF